MWVVVTLNFEKYIGELFITYVKVKVFDSKLWMQNMI